MSSFKSKVKMSKCFYCDETMKDENLKAHCKTVHRQAKQVAGKASVDSFFKTPAAKVSKSSLASSSSTSGEQLLMSGGRKTPEDFFFNQSNSR